MKIGILGGIGPEATGRFYLRLISKLQKQELIKDNTDFPQIVINSIPALELIFEKIEEKDLLLYINGLQELEKNKVDFIVMVCNTIHLYHKILQKNIKTKIINLKELIKDKLENEKINKITVLGTPGTINQGLYDFENVKHVRISKPETNKLSRAIFMFNKGIKKEAINECEKIARKYSKKGSKIILGCTEIAAMLNNKDYLDTMNVFIEYITRTINEGR